MKHVWTLLGALAVTPATLWHLRNCHIIIIIIIIIINIYYCMFRWCCQWKWTVFRVHWRHRCQLHRRQLCHCQQPGLRHSWWMAMTSRWMIVSLIRRNKYANVFVYVVSMLLWWNGFTLTCKLILYLVHMHKLFECAFSGEWKVFTQMGWFANRDIIPEAALCQ